ncbi:hypothetical protein BDV29DRAFT_186557 [Aspergillus leporis]|uniref:Uncharacterized protein n=1 Tax=Aspergillus leporis TaxID=41062 RepID=A0A5N5WI57_9EURO|nr:hypothetical protein BDV29DRAFT_186557 [Aspergillus leporis]
MPSILPTFYRHYLPPPIQVVVVYNTSGSFVRGLMSLIPFVSHPVSLGLNTGLSTGTINSDTVIFLIFFSYLSSGAIHFLSAIPRFHPNLLGRTSSIASAARLP